MKLEHELRKMIKTKVNMQIFLDDFQISYRFLGKFARKSMKITTKLGTRRNKVGTLGTK